MAETTEKPLKHLEFVHSYAKVASSGVTYVEATYRERVRPLVPERVLPALVKVEDVSAAKLAPVLAIATDTADKLLKQTDEQLDYFYVAAAKWLSLEPLKQMHAKNVEAFAATKSKYYTLVKETVDHFFAKFGSTELAVKSSREMVAAALHKAEELADPDVAVATVNSAWKQFAAIPAVSGALHTADPVVQRGYGVFKTAHDALVASPFYKQTLNFGASWASWATTTTPYKLGATYVYPLVAPVANPALDKVSKSEVYSSTIKYWQPVAAA